jgi:hypothetical protein
MSKFLLNLLLQISKVLVNSKIQFLIQKSFSLLSAQPTLRPDRPLVQSAYRPRRSPHAEIIPASPSSPRVGRVFTGNMFSFSDLAFLSHPGSRKQNRSLHTCVQDVQITRTANNMVNRHNFSLNYRLESLQNDPWVQKKHYRVARKSKHRCVLHRHNRRRGRPSLYLLAPAGTLSLTPVFCST